MIVKDLDAHLNSETDEICKMVGQALSEGKSFRARLKEHLRQMFHAGRAYQNRKVIDALNPMVTRLSEDKI